MTYEIITSKMDKKCLYLEILIKKLKSIKNDKTYNAYFILETNDKYVNLKFKRFEEKKLKKKKKF